jgi:hypothetical protein
MAAAKARAGGERAAAGTGTRELATPRRLSAYGLRDFDKHFF